jgi:uncharacterized protein (TIGR00369 family)
MVSRLMHALTPEQVDAFVARVYPATAGQGYRCAELGADYAVAVWTHDERALRPGGLISGPVQFAAADLALWFLSFTQVGLEAMAVTADMQIAFLRPAAGGDLVARAELLRAGKTRISGRVLLWIEGAEDRPVAHASGSYSLLT